jgi:RNA polymerase sigma-70 factor (ECF subfamily)
MTETTTGLIQNCLDRMRAGEPAARDQVISYCQRRLRLLVRSMLRGFPNVKVWEETSDVLQSVLLRLSTALQNLPLSSVRDLLQLAAYHTRNVLIDLARHYKNRQLVALCDELPTGGQSDPANLLQWVSFHEHVSQLPQDERILFDLLYYEGITQEEAADLLGVSLKTLKRRWKDARVSLSRWLGKNFDF